MIYVKVRYGHSNVYVSPTLKPPEMENVDFEYLKNSREDLKDLLLRLD